MAYIHHNTNILPPVFLAIVLWMSTNGYCQSFPDNEPDTKQSWKEKFFYGGSLGLQFGTLTLVDISPMVGYKVTPRLGLGINPTYKYYRYKNYYYSSDDLKINVFGAGLFGRYLLFDKLFAHAEYEYLIYDFIDSPQSGNTFAQEFQSFLVGAGYRERIAANGYMYLMALWNLNETIDSPYSNPIFRAGFSIGF